MEEKKRMNPWVPAVVMGVIAILFSFYALQQQSELQEARKEIERLDAEVTRGEAIAHDNDQEAKRQRDIAVYLQHKVEDCEKSKQKK